VCTKYRLLPVAVISRKAIRAAPACRDDPAGRPYVVVTGLVLGGTGALAPYSYAPLSQFASRVYPRWFCAGQPVLVPVLIAGLLACARAVFVCDKNGAALRELGSLNAF